MLPTGEGIPLAAAYWLSRVMMPAKIGVETDVPPKIEQGAVPAKQALSMSAIPVVGESQVLPVEPPRADACVQTRYPGKLGEASSDTSGTILAGLVLMP